MRTNDILQFTINQENLSYNIKSFIDHCFHYESERHRVAEYLWIRLLLLPKVFPRMEKIARDLGMCDRTVLRAIDDLEEIDFIQRINRPLKDGKYNAWQSNEYILNPLARAISCIQEFSSYFSSLGSYLYYHGKILIQGAIKQAKEKMKNTPRVFDANAYFYNGGVGLIISPSTSTNFKSIRSLKSAAKKNTNRTKKSGSFQTRTRLETSYDPKKGNVQDFLFRGTVIKLSRLFRLTKAATAHIAAYPDELLNKIIGRWEFYNQKQPGKKIRNKFKWLSSSLSCLAYDEGYWISMELAKALRDYLGVSDDLAAKTKEALPHETIISLFQEFVAKTSLDKKPADLRVAAEINPPIALAPLLRSSPNGLVASKGKPLLSQNFVEQSPVISITQAAPLSSSIIPEKKPLTLEEREKNLARLKGVLSEDTLERMRKMMCR